MPRDYGCRGVPLQVYDANGTNVMTVGVQSDGSYGTVVRNSAGKALTYLGTLPDGTHGIQILNANGTTLFKVTSESGQVFPRAVGNNTMRGLVSGTSNTLRPGSATIGTYGTMWRTRFESVGPTVSYDVGIFPNGGNMDWQIVCWEDYGGALPGAPAQTSVVSAAGVTVNGQVTGTFTIPTTSLLPGTGTDPAGRHMNLDFQVKANSVAAVTCDLQLNSPPVNYT